MRRQLKIVGTPRGGRFDQVQMIMYVEDISGHFSVNLVDSHYIRGLKLNSHHVPWVM